MLTVLAFFFFSTLLFGQNEVEVDTTAPLGPNSDDYSPDQPKGNTRVYFLNKELQSNGGVPDSLRFRRLPDSLVKRMQKDDDFWYVNYPFEKEQQKDPPRSVPLTEQPLFQTILWLVIIGGFAAFVIIYLANSNVALFRRKSKIIHGGEDGDTETDNIFAINYQKGIEKAVSGGNYRLAVRLMFLRLLKNLSDKKVIDYKQDRTNFDYLVQLHSTKYYTDFFRLTRNYEYCWYGQFAIDLEKFGLIKSDFENFDNKLK